MNRFREYELWNECPVRDIRLIAKKLITNIESMALGRPILRLYRIQQHKRFLGIGYWKTLVKTTSYKNAKDAYDLMVYNGKIGF